MATSLYTRLTQLVTVRDLYSPLQLKLRGEMAISEAFRAIADFGSPDRTHVSLVMEGKTPVGWTQPDLLQEDAYDPNTVLAREVKCPFDLTTFITADSTAWKAVHEFADLRAEFFFVLDGTDVVGTLFYRDLFRPAFRSCLFSLTFELEQQLLRLCLQDPEASWLALDEERRRAIEDAYRRQTERRAREITRYAQKVGGKVGWALKSAARDFDADPGEMLEHSYFSDRIEILRRRELLPPSRSFEVFEELADAKALRNWCVHPQSSDEVPAELEDPMRFWRLIQNCHDSLAELEKVFSNRGGGEAR